MLNNNIKSNSEIIKNVINISEVQKKAIKYLALANITLIGFKTTKDFALIEQLNLFKENITAFLKSDILNSSAIPMWQLLLFIVVSTPAIISQKDKSNKNKK